MSEMTHTYCWGPRGNLPGAMSRKGESLRIIVRGPAGKGKGNSALVEFEDGFQAVVSRNALRRIRSDRTPAPAVPRLGSC